MMNSIALLGRLTDNVILKQTDSGLSVCEFTIAVKRPHTKDTTDFINCVAWRSVAEFITRYFVKGQRIAANGVLTMRTYTDKNGNKRTIYEVICDSVDFCSEKNEQQATNGDEAGDNGVNMEEINDDQLPF